MARRSRKDRPDFASAIAAGKTRASRSEALSEGVDAVSVLPVGKILPRPGGDTRELSREHVLPLAESIAAFELLEPIVIDVRGQLVAGGHRLAALRILAADDRLAAWSEVFGSEPSEEESERLADLGRPDAIDLVPVRRLELDAESDPDAALAAEISENEHRRDYSRSEIRDLAERLKGAGYRSSGGRPRKGEKALMPALEVAVGKSRRTLQRILQDEADRPAEPDPEPAEAKAGRALLRAAARYLEASAGRRKKAYSQLRVDLEGLDASFAALARELGETWS